jgi:hypothetical protein
MIQMDAQTNLISWAAPEFASPPRGHLLGVRASER